MASRVFVTLGIVVIALIAASPLYADARTVTANNVADALQAGDAPGTEALASEALQSNALSTLERAHVLIDRGIARESLGRPADALLDFTTALGLGVLPQAETIRALFDRAVALDELGRTKDAITDYDAAIALAPNYAAALNNRGNAYRRLGKRDAAARDYDASLDAKNPQPEYPLFGLGQISEAMGRKDVARAFYHQALAANPSYQDAAARLAALGAPSVAALNPPPAPDPAAAKVPETSRPVRSGLVQLGAYRQQAQAALAWNRMARAGNLLAGLSPMIVPVDLPRRGRFYRLRMGPVRDTAATCAQIAARGFDCVPVQTAAMP